MGIGKVQAHPNNASACRIVPRQRTPFLERRSLRETIREHRIVHAENAMHRRVVCNSLGPENSQKLERSLPFTCDTGYGFAASLVLRTWRSRSALREGLAESVFRVAAHAETRAVQQCVRNRLFLGRLLPDAAVADPLRSTGLI
jgi:hypothetical protein